MPRTVTITLTLPQAEAVRLALNSASEDPAITPAEQRVMGRAESAITRALLHARDDAS